MAKQIVVVEGQRFLTSEAGYVVVIAQKNTGVHYAGETFGLTPIRAYEDIRDGLVTLHDLSIAPDEAPVDDGKAPKGKGAKGDKSEAADA